MITIRFTADQRTKICVRKTSYHHFDEIIVLKNWKDPDPKQIITDLGPKVTDLEYWSE